MKTWHTNLRLFLEEGQIETNNPNINNGIFRVDLFSLLLF